MKKKISYSVSFFSKDPLRYKDQIQKLSDTIFPITKSNRHREEEEYCAQGDRFGRVLAITSDGKVAGKISLYKRVMYFGGKKIVLGGIGGVGTLPVYRKIGIASSLLLKAMDELKKAKCDIVFLTTDMNSPWKPKMYGAVGFKRLPNYYTFEGKSRRLHSLKDGMIAPVLSKSLFKTILEIGNPFYIGRGIW